MNHHKQTLICLALVSRVLSALLLVVAAQLPLFDASSELVLDSPWLSSVLRWDLFHYAHIAKHGYVYEYEWAWLPGAPLIMRYGAITLERLGLRSNDELALMLGVGAAAAIFVDGTLTLYDLTLEHFHSPSFAMLSALLSLLPSSPATLHLVPLSEPFFTYLSYQGMLACAEEKWVRASTYFALAGMFRSNGMLLAIFIVWGMVVAPLFRLEVINRKEILVIFKRLFSCVILAIIPLVPFVIQQDAAYRAFCLPTDQGEPANIPAARPWCSYLPPSIYSFVQSHYWDVGPFRYWTLQQLPNFMMAAPILVLIFSSSVGYIINTLMPLLKAPFTGMPVKYGTIIGINPPFFHRDNRPNLSVAPHAIHALVLGSTLLISAHTQIALRLASSMPFTYWAAARLWTSAGREKGTPELEGTAGGSRGARWWSAWSVVWGATSLVLWSAFLPPA